MLRSNILEAKIEENSDFSEQAPLKAHTQTNVVKPPTSKKNASSSGGPYPGLFIISVIVVAILLIIILSAAGAIACYRSHQQEKIINNMQEHFSDMLEVQEKSQAILGKYLEIIIRNRGGDKMQDFSQIFDSFEFDTGKTFDIQ